RFNGTASGPAGSWPRPAIAGTNAAVERSTQTAEYPSSAGYGYQLAGHTMTAAPRANSDRLSTSAMAQAATALPSRMWDSTAAPGPTQANARTTTNFASGSTGSSTTIGASTPNASPAQASAALAPVGAGRATSAAHSFFTARPVWRRRRSGPAGRAGRRRGSGGSAASRRSSRGSRGRG